MQEYRHKSDGRPIAVSSYREAKDQLDAIFASGRLRLPFEGVLLIGTDFGRRVEGAGRGSGIRYRSRPELPARATVGATGGLTL